MRYTLYYTFVSCLGFVIVQESDYAEMMAKSCTR